MAADGNFNPYYVDIDDDMVGKTTFTDEMEADILTKSFYPAGKDNYILSIGEENFYTIELK